MAVSPQLVTPVCSVSPAGGGTIAFAPIQTAAVPGLPHGITTDGEYRSYRYTATPAQGYQFVRFETSVTYAYGENQPSTTGGWFNGTPIGGDWIYDAEPGNSFDDFFSTYSTAGYAAWTKDEGFGLVSYGAVLAISVVAVFAPVRVPTHLLVNSANAVAPVLLVHDPATDLLVADY